MYAQKVAMVGAVNRIDSQGGEDAVLRRGLSTWPNGTPADKAEECPHLLRYRHWIQLVCVAAALLLSGGCRTSSPEWRAQKAAEQFFERFSTPNPTTVRDWGMRDNKVFHVWTTEFGPDTSSGTVRIVIPFWCQGVGPDGSVRKLARRLNVHVKVDAESTTIVRYEFDQDEPLKWIEQWLWWFALTASLPAILLLIHAGWSLYEGSQGAGCLAMILGSIGLAIALTLQQWIYSLPTLLLVAALAG